VLHLIKTISISNFRAIRKGEINNLSKVNILIGKNNSGKSTVFDLLCFFKAPLNFMNDFSEPALQALLNRRVNRNYPSALEFFHNYSSENQVSIGLGFEKGQPIDFVASYSSGRISYSWLNPNYKPGVFLSQAISVGIGVESKHEDIKAIALFNLSLNDAANVSVFDGNNIGGQNPVIPLFDYLKSLKTRHQTSDYRSEFLDYIDDHETIKNMSFLSKIILVDADFVRKIESIETAYWADILKRRTDKKLIKTLNETYGLDIEGFSFANYQGQSSKIFTLLPDVSMHIDDYGDGFRYAFSILTVASQAKNTALLIEEPEVHQHEGALLPLFKALNELALSNNLQIFISTHSPKVIELWTQITKELSIFHLCINPDGTLKVRCVQGNDAELLIDLGFNPMKLDEAVTYMVVEGYEDKIFLDAVIDRIKHKSLKELGFELMECAKDSQQQTVSALASTGKKIVVFADFDRKKTLDEFIKPYINSLISKYVEVEVNGNRVLVKRTGSQISFIPMGLPEDDELIKLGIINFAMDDFLIKLLSIDKEVRTWAEISNDELKNRSKALKDNANLKACKTLLMALGVLKEQDLFTLIPNIINKADEESLNQLLSPILGQLFQP
jgi:AAA15 family ATPase/GTPase